MDAANAKPEGDDDTDNQPSSVQSRKVDKLSELRRPGVPIVSAQV